MNITIFNIVHRRNQHLNGKSNVERFSPKAEPRKSNPVVISCHYSLPTRTVKEHTARSKPQHFRRDLQFIFFHRLWERWNFNVEKSQAIQQIHACATQLSITRRILHFKRFTASLSHQTLFSLRKRSELFLRGTFFEEDQMRFFFFFFVVKVDVKQMVLRARIAPC